MKIPTDFISVLVALYESEINCRVSTFWDGGVDVWLGDKMNGYKAKTCFDASEVSKDSGSVIGAWLHEQACIHFPDSDYAKKARSAVKVKAEELELQPS